MKVSPKTKKSTYLNTCTTEHLNRSFGPTMGHWGISQFVFKMEIVTSFEFKTACGHAYTPDKDPSWQRPGKKVLQI